jgi:chitin synthase
VKYKNQGKLSAHNWFFNGICKELNPKYVVLLDVGLRAKDNSILKMYHKLREDDRLGGVCGYMSLKMEKKEEDEEDDEDEFDCMTNIVHKIVDIQRAQQV